MHFPGQICLLFSPGEGKEDVLKAVERGLPQQRKDSLGVFSLRLVHCPFEACQKDYEGEHFEHISEDWLLFDHFIFLLKELSISLLVPVLSHMLC